LTTGRLATCLVITLAILIFLPRATRAVEEATDEATAQPAANDMTLTKLDDVELQEFPWGWIRWTMNAQLDGNATMTFGVVYIKPHQTNPLHVHPTADEILHVVEGSCEHRKGDQWVKMGPGDTIRIPRGVPHNARTGDEHCRVVVVYDTGRRTMVPVQEDDRE
jgi:quercetin dioxygenase-like cupin family protein